MEIFIAPDGTEISLYEGRITTFGLTAEQNEIVRNNLPTTKYDLYDTDVVTDIIAISCTALILVPTAFEKDDLDLVIDYYTDIIDYTDETVFWLGYPKPPAKLRNKFKCYQSFDELASNLKYLLLTVHTKQKKIKEFSRKLADSLTILSLIRNHPGIKTQELAEWTEMSVRSVQRYISTLQATGEWIDYDTSKRGWKLIDNVSILFGDHLKD